MKYISIPNLPENPVKLVAVDGRVTSEIEAALRGQGIEVIKTNRYQGTYDAIAYHPDIMIHHVGNNIIVYAAGTDQSFLSQLEEYGFELIRGSNALGEKYPLNIAYNVVRIGKYAFHNLNYTDPVLKDEFQKNGIELVHINQGYAKCSVAVISESLIVTSDRGIEKAASKKGIEVILIESDENILLPGLKNGFIGGSSGMIGKNKWAVTGDISTLKSYQSLSRCFVEKDIEITQLSQTSVIDIGSIIPLITY